MKKFNLRSVSDFLSDNELKRVKAGSTGTCMALSNYGSLWCGVSKKEAVVLAACDDRDYGTGCLGNWCCDSCGTASWSGGCYD